MRFEDCEKQLWDTLLDAVGRQMVSDVKVGCQLSGGIDSSLISYIAASKYHLNDTISIAVDDPHFRKKNILIWQQKSFQLIIISFC